MDDTAVLYLHTRLSTPGGANRFVVETANRLAADPSISVTLATQTVNEDRYTFAPSVDVHQYRGPPPSSLSHWALWPWVFSRFKPVLLSEQFDVVLYHSVPLPYWAPFIGRYQPDARHVWYAHAPNLYLNSRDKLGDIPLPIRLPVKFGRPPLRVFDKYAINNYIDDILVNSRATKTAIETDYDFDPSVVYPGVDTDVFAPEISTDEEGDYLFTLGQINEYNNYDLFIDAMEMLYEETEDAPDLYIGGQGHRLPYLKQQVREKELSDKVTFLGYISDENLPRYYSAATAVVYLPENEPFGLIPVEAMSCGTPVVGFQSGGLKETVKHGHTGHLVSDISAVSVSNAILELLADPAKLELMGTQARSRVVDKFTWDRTADALRKSLQLFS